MILDYSQTIVSDSIVIFPVEVYGDQPVDPEDIREQIFIIGTAGSNSSIIGSVDN